MVDSRFDNPFHDLWITEAIGPSDFVDIFSPQIVRDAEAIFSSGNIVLKGRQGCGKSMLLSLLSTPTRIEFARANKDTPIPKHKQRFLSCSVNCIRDQVSVIGLRAREVPEAQRDAYVAAAFADLLNCLLCMDFLRSIRKIWNAQKTCPTALISAVPLCDATLVERSLAALMQSGSWREWIHEDCASVDNLIEALEQRERAYRDYANFNISEFPQKYLFGRTSLGEPISALAETFRQYGVVTSNSLVFVQIDQAEELFELDVGTGGTLYRGVVASALARRDSRVAYRIGVRRYAFVGYIPIFGSNAPLEENRDYTVIDIDNILARRENSKSWTFPKFAEDVIARRIRKLGYDVPESGALKRLFGPKLSHSEKAADYTRNMRVQSLFEPAWHADWRSYLAKLWDRGEKLEAFLGASWLRQRAQTSAKVAEQPLDPNGKHWNRSAWWRKERNEAALAQLAGRHQQALIWCGHEEILGLAGHNILALMIICQATWEAWQRRAGEALNTAALPEFDRVDQTLGVTNASAIAFRKISVGVAAESRRKFIAALGTRLSRSLMEDRSLAYPGHTGISIAEEEFSGNSGHALVVTIKACVDYGDLLEGTHTTKNKDRAPRLKWYLNPLLCPYFRIPYIRTKEPVYTNLVTLAKELQQDVTAAATDKTPPLQADLFAAEP